MSNLKLTLHSKNSAFSWTQPPPPYSVITEHQANAYRDVGGFVLDDVFKAEELSRLIAELDPIEEKVNAALVDLPSDVPTIARNDEIVFQAHVVQKSPMAQYFARHETMVALCQDLIGPAVRLYWDQLVYKRAGNSG